MRDTQLPAPHPIGSPNRHQDAAAGRLTPPVHPDAVGRSAGDAPADPTRAAAADSAALAAAVAPRRIDGLYLHIPFCFHKCHYCDFYSIVDDRDRQAAFTARLIDELRAVAPHAPTPLRTVFVGGGTPTLLRPDLWQDLLTALADALDLSALAEFTVEANPETVTGELLDTLAAGGVNRISIGAQSFDERHLKTLERWHDPANVDRAVGLARAAGIQNVNLDLIFAIPGQTPDEWAADLGRALALGPDHLSCYGLTYEPNTPMTKKLELGRIDRADEAVEARMYEHTMATLGAAGFERYEVSNFARRVDGGGSRRCLHNVGYWRGANWLAVGPSASGHLDGVRWKNAPHLGRYLASTDGSPVIDVERLDPDAALGERLMLELRLTDGVDWPALDAVLDERRRAVIDGYVADGLMERSASALLLTPRGLMIADTLLAELL